MLNYIRENLQESIEAKQKLLMDEELLQVVEKVALQCVKVYENGGKVLVCGNGGSASDAQHMTGELVGRYKIERAGIPAISLNANTAVMTALGNDYDYESVFSKQVIALGNKGDLFIGISTSGNSANVVKACEQAKKQGLVTVSLTGGKGGKLRECSEYCLNVPSDNTPRIQEMHILLIHAICGAVEKALYEKGFFEEHHE